VFENRVLRKIFGLKRYEVTGNWRKFHDKLHNLYSAPNIIRMIKLRMRWARHVAHMEAYEIHPKFWSGNLK
jgi:hypothetical protein